MNFFGHAWLAALRRDDAGFVLGAMLPDLAPMAGLASSQLKATLSGLRRTVTKWQSKAESEIATLHTSPARKHLRGHGGRALDQQRFDAIVGRMAMQLQVAGWTGDCQAFPVRG